MSVMDMRCGLPCQRELWDKQDVTEDDLEACRQQQLKSPHWESLKAVVDVLMRDRWAGVQTFPLDSSTLSGLELAVFGKSPSYRFERHVCSQH